MNPTQVFWLTVVGLAIGGADGYWQIHSTAGYVLDAKFYVGLAFASIAPVGSYFIGLSQTKSAVARAQVAADKAAEPKAEKVA